MRALRSTHPISGSWAGRASGENDGSIRGLTAGARLAARRPAPHALEEIVTASNGSLLGMFGQRKMAALFFLGFSSGVPLYLTSRTLQAWMTVEGIDLTTLGLVSLISLPYSIKFLWAP